jgi:hypothetical protein
MITAVLKLIGEVAAAAIPVVKVVEKGIKDLRKPEDETDSAPADQPGSWE